MGERSRGMEMARQKQTSKTSDGVARGIEVRTYASGLRAYRITFKYKGVRCRETLKGIAISKANQRYAENLLGEIEGLIQRKAFNYAEYFPESPKALMFGSSTLNQAIKEKLDVWLEDIERTQKLSTFKTYRKRVNKLKPIHNLRLRDLTKSILKQMVKDWGSITVKTARNNLIPLQAIIPDALLDGEITADPLAGFDVKKIVPRRARTDEADPFETNEIAAMLDKAKELYGEAVHNFFAFFFYQGLRTGEMFALQWSDIDFNKYTAHINRSRVEGHMQEETKTVSGDRIIDLTNGGYDALISQKKYTYKEILGPDDEDFVFCRKNGLPFRKYRHATEYFNTILRRTKIRARQQYQIRHTFMSHKLSYNENLFYIANQAGHKTADVLLKVYAKWIQSASGQSEMPHEFVRANPTKKHTLVNAYSKY